MAVDHVSLEIDYGDRLGLVGESGCGKSTTAQLISGLIKESYFNLPVSRLSGGL